MTSRFRYTFFLLTSLMLARPCLGIEPKLLRELELLGLDRGILSDSELHVLSKRSERTSEPSHRPGLLPAHEEYSLKRISLERKPEESSEEFRERVLKISSALTPELFLSLAKELQPSPLLRKRWSLSPMTLNQFPVNERDTVSQLRPGEISPPIISETAAAFYLRD